LYAPRCSSGRRRKIGVAATRIWFEIDLRSFGFAVVRLTALSFLPSKNAASRGGGRRFRRRQPIARSAMPCRSRPPSPCKFVRSGFRFFLIARRESFARSSHFPPYSWLCPCSGYEEIGGAMLHWALIFFVIALIAAAMGFGGVAGLSAQFGYLFVVVAVILLAIGLLGGGVGPRALP
jgi:uncharacterized membrane protein YtjA (UPF0391 family)